MPRAAAAALSTSGFRRVHDDDCSLGHIPDGSLTTRASACLSLGP